uniref:Solute carrier family 22 member 6-like isoform X1 n=1 Tax=Camelus bactrianus TaxID=9837 RepID=A0A9W3HHW4_CAMBA|nr:solute carrier family 22 member 6-like isoform X1 [Camelus bactrianus]
MTFNDLLLQVGGICRFQQIQIPLLILSLSLLYLHHALQNFTAAIPTHHCRPPADTNLSKEEDLGAWLPRDRHGQPVSCLRFTSPQRGPPFPIGTATNSTGTTETCSDGWIYDNSTFPSTTMTEWDLLCTHKTLPQLSQPIFMAGIMAGNLIFGVLADRLGRQKVLIWSYLKLAVSGTCTVFTYNFPAYCVCRFLSGITVSGPSITSFSLSLEWLPIHAQPSLGLLLGFAPTTGQLFLGGMAYAVPHWRHLQLLVSLPFFVFLICSRFFIESALWYSSLGRLELTLKALQRVAQINGKQEEGAKLSVEVGTLFQLLWLVHESAKFWDQHLPGPGAVHNCGPTILYPGLSGHQINWPQAYPSSLLAAIRDLHSDLCSDTPRQRGVSVTITLANVGSIPSPLVDMTSEFYPSLPLFIYGAILVAACPITVLLPETMGQPLPNTVQDLERRRKKKSGQKQQEQQMVPLQSS